LTVVDRRLGQRQRRRREELIMGMRMRRRTRQLAFVTLAVPVAAWALEQAARRAEARDQASPASRCLRQGADLVQQFGRGPLADRPATHGKTVLV
jgi:hypothetical protein